MKNNMVVRAVLRDEAFSPNSVEADREILKLTAEKVGEILSMPVDYIKEPLLGESCQPDNLTLSHSNALWLSMARSERALNFLSDREHDGDKVVNSPQSVRKCRQASQVHESSYRRQKQNGF